MRYAIYYTPAKNHPLTQAGAAWLGRDAFEGKSVTQADLCVPKLSDLTKAPRRYGFHATMKAPFRLKAGKSEAELQDAFHSFAGSMPSFNLTLHVETLRSFLALTPTKPSTALNAFASHCVRHFEPFRAPLSEADIQRRRPDTLTARQRGYLKDYGYPYIFDDFRFHMTLSNPLDDADKERLAEAARLWFSSSLSEPLEISTLALAIEPEPGAPFTINTLANLMQHSGKSHTSANLMPKMENFDDRA